MAMTTDNKTLLLKGLPSKLGKHDVQAFVKKATNNLVFLQVYPWRFGPEDHQALAVLRFEDAENTRLAYSRIASLIEISKAKECSFDPTYLRIHFKFVPKAPTTQGLDPQAPDEGVYHQVAYKPWQEPTERKDQGRRLAEEKRNRYKPMCPKCGKGDCLYFVFFGHD